MNDGADVIRKIWEVKTVMWVGAGVAVESRKIRQRVQSLKIALVVDSPWIKEVKK